MNKRALWLGLPPIALVALVSLVLTDRCASAPIAAPAAMGSGGGGASPGGFGTPDGGVIPGYAVVVFNPGSDTRALESNLRVTELEATTIGGTTYHLLHSGQRADLVDALDGDPNVAFVFPHKTVWGPGGVGEPMSFDNGSPNPTEGDYVDQPVLARIRLVEARPVTNGAGVRVAILDTGVDRTHPVFVENHAAFIMGYDWSVLPHGAAADERRDGRDGDGDRLVDEGYGHGTHVTGIVHLVAPGATLAIVKVLDDEGWGTCFGLASGIVNALELGAQVINLSVGMLEPDHMVERAVREATARGVAVIASAGNRATAVPQFPAAYDDVLCVTAVDKNDMLWSSSNTGRAVDMSAPGVSLMPDGHPFGRYAAGQGASFAAPGLLGSSPGRSGCRPPTPGCPAVAMARRSPPIGFFVGGPPPAR